MNNETKNKAKTKVNFTYHDIFFISLKKLCHKIKQKRTIRTFKTFEMEVFTNAVQFFIKSSVQKCCSGSLFCFLLISHHWFRITLIQFFFSLNFSHKNGRICKKNYINRIFEGFLPLILCCSSYWSLSTITKKNWCDGVNFGNKFVCVRVEEEVQG